MSEYLSDRQDIWYGTSLDLKIPFLMVFTDPPPFSTPPALSPGQPPKTRVQTENSNLGIVFQMDIPCCMVLSCFLGRGNCFPSDFQPFPDLCDGQMVPFQKPDLGLNMRMGSRALRVLNRFSTFK